MTNQGPSQQDLDNCDNESDRRYDDARDMGALRTPDGLPRLEELNGFNPERVNAAIRRLRELGAWK